MRTATRLAVSGMAAAALLLTACGDDDSTDDQAGAATTQQATGEESPQELPADDVEEQVVPFDPAATVALNTLEVDGELIFADGPLPDSLVVPAGTTLVMWDSDMPDNVQYHNATGSLWVDDPEATAEEVQAFFVEHLTDAGWELVEEHDSGLQTWHNTQPTVQVAAQEFRVETLPRDKAVIRWWFTNNG